MFYYSCVMFSLLSLRILYHSCSEFQIRTYLKKKENSKDFPKHIESDGQMELCTNVSLFDVLTILIHHFVLFYSILSQKEKTENNTQSSCMVFFFVFYVGWAYILRGSLFIKVVSQWIQATRNLLQCYPIFGLKVVPTTSLLLCFLRLKESTCETSKNVFYFTSKALFVLEIIKF